MLKILATNNKVSVRFPWRSGRFTRRRCVDWEQMWRPPGIVATLCRLFSHLCLVSRAPLTCPLLSPDQFDFVTVSAPS